MSLLNSHSFDQIFTKFVGLKVGYLQLPGNVGDRLIATGAKSLFDTFNIDYIELSEQHIFENCVPNEIQEIVISGGGNLGRCYEDCYKLRQASVKCGLPVTILPQSFASFDEDLSSFNTVYVRETTSLAVDSSVQLMPDLALFAPDTNAIQFPSYPLGLFLREDIESVFLDRSLSIVDPVRNNYQPDDYIEFASRFSHVITDRLHFAIAALIAGRQATLLPNSTGKNKAMFDTWLESLGCQWLDNPSAVKYETQAIHDSGWKLVTPIPKSSLPWHSVYQRITKTQDDQSKELLLNENEKHVLSLCDGARSISELLVELAKEKPKPITQLAEDVATNIHDLYSKRYIRPMLGKELLVEVLSDSEIEGWVVRRALVQRHRQRATELWFAVPKDQKGYLNQNADSFLIAMLMQAMFDNVPIQITGGKISQGLIENLYQFQDQWRQWRPELNKIEIHADVNSSKAMVNNNRLLAFSGGLDSCHALHQHNIAKELGLQPVNEALMVQGFDIPLSDTAGFNGAVSRAEVITNELSLPLLKLKTNFRGVVKDHWQDPHGAALAAALTMLGGGYSTGVIASTMNKNINHVWGSNPMTDPLLGSNNFTIEHFGYETDRLEKLKNLAEWEIAVNNLRVCWKGVKRGENCGHCRKCVMTQLSLCCLNLPLSSFKQPLNNQELNQHIPQNFIGALDSYDLHTMANQLIESKTKRANFDEGWQQTLVNLFSEQN